MRINKYLALHTSLSRRRADDAIAENRVVINGKPATAGMLVKSKDEVLLDDVPVRSEIAARTLILLNKPVGYVCSRRGQGSRTIYDLLPENYQNLKPAGRLDKNSSGLVLLTNDGDLLFELTHPSKKKNKIYEIILNKPLSANDVISIKKGVKLEDGISALGLTQLATNHFEWKITMHEGRNRQIRRTFSALGYEVVNLHRTAVGDYQLDTIPLGKYILHN